MSSDRLGSVLKHTKVALCPKCAESEHYYPSAKPTGRITKDGRVELYIPNKDNGHCLSCGYYQSEEPF